MALVAPEMLPLARIAHWERARADKPYLIQPMGAGRTQEWTWAQAADEARRIAAWLKARGGESHWEPGARIAILSKNCAHWIMADWAIWMAGYVSVPLYPTLTADSVRQVLEHSESRAIFVGKLDSWETMKAGVPQSVLRFGCVLSPPDDFPRWEELVAATAPLAALSARKGEELATIMYTSGTTGVPKGVMHSFENFALTAQVMRESFAFGAEDRSLSYLPLSHVAERFGVEANTLGTGHRIYFAESLETFAQDLRRARPTAFFSVPRLWVKFQQGVYAKLPKQKLDRLLKLPLIGRIVGRKILKQLGLDSVRWAATGAAPLPAQTIAWYRRLGLDLMEVYGMTENFGLSHTTRPEDMRVGYVGRPWPHVECRLSEAGEVLVRAPWNMLGYYKEPELTREAFTDDGFLKTGDLGELDEAGRLRITGRVKELFKTAKGKYVAPAPIENKLGTHPQIEAVCVAGAGYPQAFALVMLPAAVAATVADRSVSEALTRSLDEHLRQVNATLDPHEQLAFIAVVREQWTVDNGFVTPTMKVRRAAIEKAYGPHFDAWCAAGSEVVWTVGWR